VKWLLLLFGIFLPRVSLVVCYLMGLFSVVPAPCCIIPVFAFLFFPYTLLAYCFAYVISEQVTLGWMVIILLAFLTDIKSDSEVVESTDYYMRGE